MAVGNIGEWSASVGFTTTFISNYEVLAVRRLLHQYRKTVNLPKLINDLFSKEIPRQENVSVDMLTRLDIDASSDAQLDSIGELVGQERLGFSDPDYRILLKGKQAVNNSEGSINEMIDAWALLTNSPVVILVENYPHSMMLFATNEVDAGKIDLVFGLIQLAAAGGVKVSHFGVIPADDEYALAETADDDLSPYTPVISSTQGLGDDTDPGYGGKYYGLQK